MTPKQLHIAAALLALLAGAAARAQSTDDDDLALLGGQAQVSIASGSAQPLKRAAAVVSVITADDIANMGATKLGQALEGVAGLHVSVFHQGYSEILGFRGIHTGYNPQVLMLVNGTPVNDAFVGNRGNLSGPFGLENVARIEVIRGPGSAMYGADAFAGTINVITKTAAEIDGTHVGARLGSFASRAAWIEHGGALGPFSVAAYLSVDRSDGQRRVIDKDLQAMLDPLFGTHATRAPGALDLHNRTIEANLNVAYGNWRLRSGYRNNVGGLGPDIADSLGRGVDYPASRHTADLSYQKDGWAPNWDVAAALEYVQIKQKSATPDPWLFPPGGLGGLFPNGAIGNPTYDELNTAATVNALYTGFERHRLRVGAGARVEDMYQVGERKNFTITVVPGKGAVVGALPEVVEAANNPALVYLLPAKRTLRYAFAQDEWALSNDVTLTAGVRHDHYSDFGGTTNPRLALVWDARYNLVIKALHGRAFRAPSFVEEYPGVNPTSIGNPNLKPEKIATNELVFDWEPTDKLKTTLTLFHYRERDIITFVPNADPSSGSTAQNTGDQVGRGGELELRWDASRQLRLSGNYSLQRSTDQASGKDAGLAPHRHLFARADWRLANAWQLGGTLNHVAGRRRQPDDPRPNNIADYTTVDLTLRREKLFGQWELRGTIRNLFNRDAREPSLSPGNIPFDFPLAGRAAYIELRRAL